MRRLAILVRRPWVVLIALSIGLHACDSRSKGEQHYWSGHAYQEQGMTANALREYRSAVAAGVDSPAAYYALGALYGEKDEHGKAIAAYRELLEALARRKSSAGVAGGSLCSCRTANRRRQSLPDPDSIKGAIPLRCSVA